MTENPASNRKKEAPTATAAAKKTAGSIAKPAHPAGRRGGAGRVAGRGGLPCPTLGIPRLCTYTSRHHGGDLSSKHDVVRMVNIMSSLSFLKMSKHLTCNRAYRRQGLTYIVSLFCHLFRKSKSTVATASFPFCAFTFNCSTSIRRRASAYHHF